MNENLELKRAVALLKKRIGVVEAELADFSEDERILVCVDVLRRMATLMEASLKAMKAHNKSHEMLVLMDGIGHRKHHGLGRGGL